MEFQSCHNTLIEVEQLGFQVTWKFINIGLHGNEKIPVQISYNELFEYLDNLLERNIEESDNIISIWCEQDDIIEVDKLLESLTEQEAQDVFFESRKWRAYQLKKILDNVKQDCLQGLLEMMEFWLPMKDEKECPHVFPQNNDDGLSVQQYFSQTMYEFLIQKNRSWLEKEILTIIKKESC